MYSCLVFILLNIAISASSLVLFPDSLYIVLLSSLNSHFWVILFFFIPPFSLINSLISSSDNTLLAFLTLNIFLVFSATFTNNFPVTIF
jgi:hypothetical protein